MYATNILHDLMKNGGSHGFLQFDQAKNQFLIPTTDGKMQHIPYSLAEIVIRDFRGMAVYDVRTKDLWRI